MCSRGRVNLQTTQAKVMHMRIVHVCICKLQQRIRAGQLLEGSLSSQHGVVSHAGHCSRQRTLPLACVAQSGRVVANSQLHCISWHHHLQAPGALCEGWPEFHKMNGCYPCLRFASSAEGQLAIPGESQACSYLKAAYATPTFQQAKGPVVIQGGIEPLKRPALGNG